MPAQAFLITTDLHTIELGRKLLILDALSQGYLSLSTIDRIAFYGIADRGKLKTLLNEMMDKSLIRQLSNGCYQRINLPSQDVTA